MNKRLLAVFILISGTLLSALHYKLKPSPTDKEVRSEAIGMMSRVDWRGQIAPDFELTTTTGAAFQLSDHVGKQVIILNFFATWCGPCRVEMPELNRYSNEHKSDSLLMVGIDAEEKRDRVEGFLTDLQVNFPAGIDAGAIRKQYGVEMFPTTVVIGVDGKVQFYESGALVNAEVAFDNLLQQNKKSLQAGQVISSEAYRAAVEKQKGLPLRKPEQEAAAAEEDEFKLNERGKRIAERMVCPCGCDDKVKACSCHTSKNVKKALATEDFKDQPDDEIIKGLNKRFCSGAM